MIMYILLIRFWSICICGVASMAAWLKIPDCEHRHSHNRNMSANSNYNDTQGLLTEFIDGSHGTTMETFNPPIDDTFADGYTPGLDLQEWFSRPLKIKEYTWNVGDPLFEGFNPWYDYFNNPAIFNKLRGYSRLQATLHLKLVINAPPYYYSAGILSYLPMSGIERNTAVAGNYTDAGPNYRFSGGTVDPSFCPDNPTSGIWSGGTTSSSLMVRTSRPNAWFYPQSSKGCEMVLPFCYHKNWVNLGSINPNMDPPAPADPLEELKDMGVVTLWSPVPLRSTTSLSTTPVTITMYAWCDMHKVAGPSFVTQSGDEYSDKPVSQAMSTVSRAAQVLSYVPSIRPYAMATSMAASSVGSVAKWFGFSNPPVIDNVRSEQINYMPHFASPEISTQQDKLSLDPKNEVTVDSRTVGLDGVDHMSIRHIIGRDVSYAMANWDSSMVPTSVLFMQHVTPMISEIKWHVGSVTGAPVASIQPSPAAHVGAAFGFWTGRIKYTFTAVASQFHRGRLMINFDPDGFKGWYPSAAFEQPYTISKIWDLAETPSFSFEVPWMSSRSYLKTDVSTYEKLYSPSYYGSTVHGTQNYLINPTLPYNTSVSPSAINCDFNDSAFNGSIIVSVLNTLTNGTSDSSPVKLIVSIDCSEVEFAGPVDFDTPLSYFRLESGADEIAQVTDEGHVDTEAPPYVWGGTTHDIYYGEIVRSIRQLLHRTVFYGTFPFAPVAQVPKASTYAYIPEVKWFELGVSTNPRRLGNDALLFYYCATQTLPNLPYMSGALPSNFHHIRSTPQYIDTGVWQEDDVASGGEYSGYRPTHPTPTSYFSNCYVGWRGSTCYVAHFRGHASKPASGNSGDGLVSAANFARSDLLPDSLATGLSIWEPMVTSFSALNNYSLTDPQERARSMRNSRSIGIPNKLHVGQAGMAVTNPTKVDVLNSIVPYYCNFRMLPANFMGNLLVSQSPSSSGFFSNETFGSSSIIEQPTLSVKVEPAVSGGSGAGSGWIKRDASTGAHSGDYNDPGIPDVDLYHKAGVDFTCFWYLNPPTVYVYQHGYALHFAT